MSGRFSLQSDDVASNVTSPCSNVLESRHVCPPHLFIRRMVVTTLLKTGSRCAGTVSGMIYRTYGLVPQNIV